MPLPTFTSRFRTAGGSRTEPTLADPATAAAPAAMPAVADAATAIATTRVAGEPPAPPAPTAEGPSPGAEGRVPPKRRDAAKVRAAIRSALRTSLAAGAANARPLAACAALVLALGAGYLAGNASFGSTTAASLAAQGEETARLAGEVARLRIGLEASRAERGPARPDARQAQLLDKVERTGQDNAARIGRLADQLERIEKAQRDTTRSQLVLDRIDRLERALAGQPAAQAAASAPPAPAATASLVPPTPAPAARTPPPKPAAGPDVAQTGSIPDGKPAKAEADPRKTALQGYVLRDVDEGTALIETRSGRFHEVMVGQTLPGIGRVEAIERRGRQWVVVTPRGFVAERWN